MLILSNLKYLNFDRKKTNSNQKRYDTFSRIFSFILGLCVCLSLVSPVMAYEIPEPNASFYVNDTVDLMTNENEDYIIAANEDLCDKTGAQVVVVTIQSLDGVSIEEYSTELFRKYGIGDAEKNNGILFLLSLEDRECRIEVGYGLEGVINDAKAGRIMDDLVIPYFKEGKWEEGILNGFDAILDEICEEYGVEVEHNAPRVPSKIVKEKNTEDYKKYWHDVLAGAVALLGGLLIGYLYPNKALIPGSIFLIAYFAVLIGIFTAGHAILSFILGVVTYLIGWAITSPSPGGGYSSSSYSSSSSSRSYSSHSSSYNSGGGGRSGGGGASRKF